MVSKEIIRSIIQEGQEAITDISLYSRAQFFEDVGRYVLVGIRQAGKSYMLYQRAQALIASGHDVRELVFINFDDERLIDFVASDFDTILQAYGTLSSCKPILFFDEIQNIVGWEHFARRLANSKYQVYITGSNAKMLSRDIATTLGGRYIDQKVFPYSFREYVCATGVLSDSELEGDNWEYGQKRLEVLRAMNAYFTWGGFPELLLFRGKREWLNSLYNKILLGDIIQRNGIRNGLVVRLVVKRLAENLGQPTSYNRLANTIKAAGSSTSTASVVEYVSFVRDACILFAIDNYASKFAEKETVKKHYFIDNGLLNIFLHTGVNSALHENICAVELHRRYGEGLFYYRRNVEVDFYVPQEGLAVQACYSTEDIETLGREVTALVKLSAVAEVKRMVIVSYDDERLLPTANGDVEVVPLWKWLLR